MSFRLLRTLLLFSILPSIGVWSQGLTGIWRGYFITDQFEQYKFEIQIEQIGPSIQGVSYSYLNTSFYGKAALKGNMDTGSKSVRLQETQTLELKMSDGSHSCIMDCKLVWARSGKEEFLEGTFTSIFEKSAPGIRKGADCGDGKVYLRRVTESDFYLESFLKNTSRRTKPVFDNQAPPSRNTAKTLSVNTSNGERSADGKNLITALQDRNPDRSTPPNTIPANPNKSQELPTPESIKSRINELARELYVPSRIVRVRLYDNGEIDGDTVTVYLGNRTILSQKRLTAAPLEFQFEIPEDTDLQEVTLVANNLGTIPPNTSLMIVEAGDQRNEVRITSTEQKNAVVRFRYRPEK